VLTITERTILCALSSWTKLLAFNVSNPHGIVNPMTKIYTKTGDKGTTASFDGERISKDALRLRAYGTVDEANSILGVVLSLSKEENTKKWLKIIQNDLFIIQAELAGAPEELTSQKTTGLEETIDELTSEVGELIHFILPGGTKSGAMLHYARTVVRRAEREVVALSKKEHVSQEILTYLNRLSDFLFTLARFENRRKKETPPHYS